MKSFPIYAVANLVTEIIGKVSNAMYGPAVFYFTLFELIYFIYFLSRVNSSASIRRWLWGACGLILVAIAIRSMIRHDINSSIGPLVLLESLLIIAGCVAYFIGLFRMAEIPPIGTTPAIWMVGGMILYFVLEIPIVLFTALFVTEGEKSNAAIVYSFNNYVQVISYSLFIYAILCRRKTTLYS